jgi:RNA polymerase sigma factor (sigma-70 family)
MQELFDKAAAGDSSAQDEIAAEIRRIARTICRRQGPGGIDVDWEDVAQEASRHFFAVAIHRFRKRGAERSYLFAIVRTTFLQILRASKRRRDRENTAPPPEPRRHDVDAGMDVRNLLSRISEECSKLLQRIFLHGETYGALAAELDVLESSVRTKVSRCLRRARTMATEEDAA